MLAKYEDLVTNPFGSFSELFDFAGISDMSRFIVRKIHSRSLKKNATPPIDEAVFQLCMDLQNRFYAVADAAHESKA